MNPLKICIVGTGAIGGLIGGKLAESHQSVTYIDIGERLQSLQENGLQLIMADGTELVDRSSPVTGDCDEAGPQDYVILALKAHQIHSVAEKLPALYKADTAVVTVQNGMPWWYFQRQGGPYEGHSLECLDPSGIIRRHIPSERILGCVAYPAAHVDANGIVHHVEGDRFPIGELDGATTERAKKLFEAFTGAGFRSRIMEDIRAELWLKSWGTLSFNPISALTRATMVDICELDETRSLVIRMMEEAQTIANKLGIKFRHTIEKRVSGAAAVGGHKTSMLQDVEAGRELEYEALVGSILEFARLTQTPAPTIETIYACIKLLNKEISGSSF